MVFRLEHADSEVISTLSLAQLSVLAHTLAVPVDELLGDGWGSRDPHVSFAELSDRLQQQLRQRGMSLVEFETEIGWKIESVLHDLEQFWSWNTDGLGDICAALRVSWLAALPRELPPAGTPLLP